MANISKTIVQQAKEQEGISLSFNNKYYDNVPFEHATEVTVYCFATNFMRTFQLPKKKLVDLAWIMNKVQVTEEGEQAFVSLTKTVTKWLKAQGMNHFSVYAASYGIGLCVVFGSDKTVDTINTLAAKLTEQGIKFRNEFSDGRWAYRFVISKSKANMEQLRYLSI